MDAIGHGLVHRGKPLRQSACPPAHPGIGVLRSIISLVLTGGWLWWKGYNLLGVNRKWLLVRGIFGTIGLATFFHTLRFIPIASATVIQYLSPSSRCCWPGILTGNGPCAPSSGPFCNGICRGLDGQRL